MHPAVILTVASLTAASSYLVFFLGWTAWAAGMAATGIAAAVILGGILWLRIVYAHEEFRAVLTLARGTMKSDAKNALRLFLFRR